MDNHDPDLTFEDAMQRLEQIVHALEDGELSLEASLALYKEGINCSRACAEKLEKARHELQIWQAGEAVSVPDLNQASGGEF